MKPNYFHIRLIIFTVTIGLLIFLNIQGVFLPVENFLSRAVLSPLLSLADGFFSGGDGKYEVLRKENQKLLVEIAELETLRKENEALTRALGLVQESGRKVLPASLVGFFRFFGNEIVVINRGKESGILIGDIVLTEEKIFIGKIVASNDGRADVLLVTSPTATHDVTFPTSGIRARARGVGAGELIVDLVPESAPVEAGDVFVISPRAGDFSSWLLVGQVREVMVGASPVFKKIRAIHPFQPERDSRLFIIASGKIP